MCQSYRKLCACGENTAEIFFGRNILDESSVVRVYCPRCSGRLEKKDQNRVWDNGWVLELDPEVIQTQAETMEIPAQEVSAERVFDEGFVTWVGITPNDSQQRDRERMAIQNLAKTDLRAYLTAMKTWGISRENRFTERRLAEDEKGFLKAGNVNLSIDKRDKGKLLLEKWLEIMETTLSCHPPPSQGARPGYSLPGHTDAFPGRRRQFVPALSPPWQYASRASTAGHQSFCIPLPASDRPLSSGDRSPHRYGYPRKRIHQVGRSEGLLR